VWRTGLFLYHDFVTMVWFVLALTLAQVPRCTGEGAALMRAASERAAAFDLAGAAERLAAAWKARCADADLPTIYVGGWLAAREAYRFGGSPESLNPVVTALSVLKAISDGAPWGAPGLLKSTAPGTAASAEIAFFVLQAASAAAQSERDALSLLIEHAVQLESVRLAAGLTGAPIITAHEAAGDLWLQVHRYEDARRAYLRAAERVGATPRVTLGLARTAARLEDVGAACVEYRTLATAWKRRGTEPLEISEARAFLREPACRTPSAERRP